MTPALLQLFRIIVLYILERLIFLNVPWNIILYSGIFDMLLFMDQVQFVCYSDMPFKFSYQFHTLHIAIWPMQPFGLIGHFT